jgi:Tol biopolymer transport system component/DNA-binding winged helix-turn-helix (wHTH) protein
MTNSGASLLHFGAFETDLATGELWRNGRKLKLQPQPFKVLALLLERQGELVTREEIRQLLWGQSTNVDFEHGLNFVIRRIRETLGDNAERPRYIETLPRRGYRFVAPVEQIASAETSRPPSSDQAVNSSHWRVGLGGLALIIVIAGTLGLLRPALPPPRVTRSIQVTHDGFDKERIVTDGARLYFSSYRRDTPSLFRVFAAGGDTVPFQTAVRSPFVFDISPDRSELLVGSCPLGGDPSDCPIWIVPVLGGSPRRLNGIAASDATWSPDGKHVAYVNDSSLYQVKVDGTESEKIVSLAGATRVFWTRWSPDGKRLRFSVSAGKNGTSLWEVSADGGNLHPLLSGWNTPPGECCGSWTPDGRYFIFQSDRGGNKNVWVMREVGGLLKRASREPVPLTAGPTSATSATPSRDGSKVFLATARAGELMRYDPASRQFFPYLSGMSATGVRFSPDGKSLAYVAYPDGTLWRSRADGSGRVQLTFPPLFVIQPRWSPDGTRIAFMALEPHKLWSVYVISADGNLSQVAPGERCGWDPTWSPDGNALLVGCSYANAVPDRGNLSLRIVNLQTHAVLEVPGSEHLWSPRWSPDGRRILALSRGTGWLMLFDVKTQKWTQLARVQASWPEWSRKGDYIYFTDASKGSPASGLFRIRVRDHQLEQVAALKDFRQPWIDFGAWEGLAPDDSPLLLRESGTQDIFALDVDWP